MALITDPIDFLLDVDGDLVVTTDIQFSSGLAAVAQGIRIRIQTFKGEWFANLDFGVPYFQDILGQKFNDAKIRTAFRNAIISTPGVLELTLLETEFNRSTRELSVSWRVTTVFGDTEDELLLTV